MCKFRKIFLLPTIFLVLTLSWHGAATAQTATPTNTATTLGAPTVVPGVYESTIAAIGSLATSATAALKTNRSDARTMALRTALAKALNNAGAVVTSITLGTSDDQSNPALLGESAMLCNPRHDYVANSIYLNYLNTLVQDIDTVSATPPTPTDILSALKVLFASSNYAIADNVDLTKISDDAQTALTNCQADLNSYEQTFYGTKLSPRPAALAAAPGAAAPATTGVAVDTFAFLGPIGGAIDTFLSILQPVLIQASLTVNEAERFAAVKTALDQNEDKIKTAGTALATAVDNFAAASRLNLAGSFVEQLAVIRDTKIDVSSVDDCKHLSLPPPPAPGTNPAAIPKSGLIGCFSAAWAKIQPMVTNLNSAGDAYDTAADNNTITTTKKFATIMANFDKYKGGAQQQFILDEVSQFVAFATSVYNAASKTNISALKAAVTAAEK